MNRARTNTLFPKGLPLQRGMAWGIMIILALFFFEIFNFSTTDFALNDLLGELDFVGIRWSTILAVAFCGIDFAGIARIFTPEEGADEPAEVWYLFGAWLLAATMNAMLTWWGVSIAILNHETLGNAVIERSTLLQVVPIFVATLVWLSRVLLIGSFSVAGERLFSQGKVVQPANTRNRSFPKPATRRNNRLNTPRRAPAFKPAPKPKAIPRPEPTYGHPEPTYHPVSMKGRSTTSKRR